MKDVYAFLPIPLIQSRLPLLPSPLLLLADARKLERLFDDEFMVGWLRWNSWLARLLERGEERYSKMRASDIVDINGE